MRIAPFLLVVFDGLAPPGASSGDEPVQSDFLPFLATCGGSPANVETTQERAVPWSPGETLEYDVSRVPSLVVATATVAITAKAPSCGSVAYRIVATGRPVPFLAKLYRVYYEAGTLLDATTLLPQASAVYSEEWKRTRLKTTRFDRAARQVRFQMRTKTDMRKDLAAPADAHDPLSAIYALRAVPLHPGAPMTMRVTESGRWYDATLTIAPPERVRTGVGERRAYKISAVVREERNERPTRQITLWLSDEAQRLPVQLTTELWFGPLTFTLRDVRQTFRSQP